MAIEVNSATLGAINNGLQTSFNSQLYRADSPHARFCYAATSTGREEVYANLALLRGPREWLGDRIAQQLSQGQFTIRNRSFEQTITVGRVDIEDDRVGMYAPIAAEMGEAARVFPATLVAALIKSGKTTVGYDGQNFFDTDHAGWDAAGAVINTVSNYQSGASPGWLLIDNTRVLKPFIVQTRVPFSLTTRFNPDDPNVFDRDEFLWGTRGRMNVGFGLWQLAFYSEAAFTKANLIAARTAMGSIYRPDGSPMGIMPNMVVVPSTLYPKAMSFYRNNQVMNAGGTALEDNDIVNMFEPVEFPWLN